MCTFDEVVERFSAGLDAGLQCWAEQPGALTVGRNGGNELALRSQVLGHLEEALDCDAFSESEGCRADASFWAEETLKAAIEFKHHLLHLSQFRYIVRDDQDAMQKLARFRLHGHEPVASFAVHFVFALHGEEGCRLAEVHNDHVTTYKQFQPREVLRENFWKASLALGHPFGEYRLESARSDSWGLLICWADAVFEDGSRMPVRVEGAFDLEA